MNRVDWSIICMTVYYNDIVYFHIRLNLLKIRIVVHLIFNYLYILYYNDIVYFHMKLILL